MIIKKKRRFWATMLTGLAVSLIIPMGVKAEDSAAPATGDVEYDMSTQSTDVELTIEKCPLNPDGTSSCRHFVYGKSVGGGIVVKSGVHNITIGSKSDGTKVDAEIDFSDSSYPVVGKSAFVIETGATVNLTIKDESINKIGSGVGKAGILVPTGATLNILKDVAGGTAGKLEAISANGGAGIGGESNGNLYSAGTIKIEGGDIIARGGKGASGIGGTVGGSSGDITILGGNIKAFGGDSESGEGGAGIGCGTGGKGGSLTISGTGTIKAIGGLDKDRKRRAGGITCATVSSEIGSGFDIYTNYIPEESVNSKGLNALVWTYGEPLDENGDAIDFTDDTLDPSVCTIYGNATLTEKLKEFGEKKDSVLWITEDTSLTIPDDLFPGNNAWALMGSIYGSGKLINANKVSYIDGQHIDDTIQRRVLVTEGDFIGPRKTTYTGFDLSETVLEIRESRDGFKIDTTGWELTIVGNNKKNTEIINADTYTITYKHARYKDITFKVEVDRADLKNCTISNINSYPYTGQEITPVPTVELVTGNKKYELTSGVDYSVAYDSNVEVGTAKLIIKAASSSSESRNFTGENSKEFTITTVPINEATVTVDPKEDTYNGKKQKPKSIEVSLGGVPVKPADYDIKWSKDGQEISGDDGFKDAGTYTVSVIGKGNYGGEAKGTYTIKPITLTITGASAKDKPFDGTPDVELIKESITFDSAIVIGDDKIEIAEETIKGKLTDENGNEVINAGTYNNIKVEGITLTNPNYILAGKVQLSKPAVITPIDGPAITVERGEYDSPDGVHFLGQIVAKPSGTLFEEPVYQYKMGDGEWQDADTFMVDPDVEYTFTVRKVGTGNVRESVSEPQVIVFPKKDQAAPDVSGINYEIRENGDGTYRVVLNPIGLENVEYSFDETDEKVFSDVFEKIDCEPSGTYSAYIRYKETPVLKASAPSDPIEIQIPTPTVEKPIISEGGEFRGTKEIAITSTTKDAIIHYTLDGTPATVETTRTAKSGEPITIGESLTTGQSLTVNAIATRPGMNESAAADAQTFTKTGDEAYRTRVNLRAGIIDDELSVDSPELALAGYTAEDIMNQFRTVLSPFEDIAFYDMTILLRKEGKWEKLTKDNFPLDGITVTIKCPAGTSTATHDFRVSHMHGYDSDRLGVSLGVTEEPEVIKTENGQLQFTVTSASPLAIAWGEAAYDPNDPNNPNNPDGSEGSEGPESATRVDLKKLTNRRLKNNSPELVDLGYAEDSVQSEFKSILSSFQYEDIAFYEMRVAIRQDNKWEKLTKDNFPLDGVTVTVKCPSGTSTEANDFAVSHMHGYDSDRLGVYAGSTEEPTVTKTEDGQLQFTITSASPLAIAWKKAEEPNPDDPNNPANPDDPGNTDDPGSTDDPGTTDDPANNGQGDQNGSGSTNGTTSGSTQNGSSTGSATSSVLPRTGDPITFVPWIIAAVVCVGVLVGLKKRGNSKKKTGAKSKSKNMNSKAKRR